MSNSFWPIAAVERVVVHGRHLGGDADVLQPAGEEVGVLAAVTLAAVEEPQLQLFAVLVARAVAVGVGPAGLVEQRLGLVGVVVEQLVLGDLEVPRRVGRRNDRRAGDAVADQCLLDQQVAIDGVVDGLANLDVRQRRVAVTRRRRAAGVHRQLAEAALVAGDRLDGVAVLDAGVRLLGHAVEGVDLAALQRLELGVLRRRRSGRSLRPSPASSRTSSGCARGG